MQLVVHIGAPKTGSTAIQQALVANRQRLLEAGVLYPRLHMSANNHTLLTAGVYREEVSLGRLIRPRVTTSGKSREEVYEADIAYLKEQIAETNPSCLVLSTEALFRSWKKLRFEQFLRDLDVSPEQVSIVCYLRNPADRYLSLTQQGLKHSSRIKYPDAYPIKSVLRGYLSYLPGRVNLRRHARGVDVVEDFVGLIAPELSGSISSAKRANETVSAEVMQIVQDFRLEHFPDSDNVRVPKATSLWRKLRRAELSLGKAKKPRLKAHVRQYILARARPDVEWVEAQLGQNTGWLDELEPGEHRLDLSSQHRIRVADICEVDPDYVSELREMATRTEPRKRRRQKREKETQVSSKPRYTGWLRRLLRTR